MQIAPDGSPVQLYLRLPDRTEDAELLHGLLQAGGSVLDLGCGTGRLAEPLARLGHPVTGVDNEPRMLAALRLATGCAPTSRPSIWAPGSTPFSQRPSATSSTASAPSSASPYATPTTPDSPPQPLPDCASTGR